MPSTSPLHLACLGLMLVLPMVATQEPKPATLAQQAMLDWHDDYASALEEAQETGKPIFLEFRCAP